MTRFHPFPEGRGKITLSGEYAVPMLPQEIIRKKRNGEALAPEEIRYFANGLCDGSIAAEQVSALAMVVFFRSMDFTETAELTRAMAPASTLMPQ